METTIKKNVFDNSSLDLLNLVKISNKLNQILFIILLLLFE